MATALDWLLGGPAWLGYKVRLDLLGMPVQAAEVQAARKALLADPAVRQLIVDLQGYTGPAIKSHKTTLWYHKLGFLADVGCRHDDPGIQPVVERILASQSPEGPFTVTINLPRVFGGDGEDHQTYRRRWS